MNDIELFESFQNVCLSYKDLYEAIMLEKDDNQFKLLKPGRENKGFLMFVSSVGSARHQGCSSSIKDLLENAVYTVGEEMFDMEKIKCLGIELEQYEDEELEENPDSRKLYY